MPICMSSLSEAVQIGRQSVMSSAKIVMPPSDKGTVVISSMQSPSRGPSTEPCGTPDDTGSMSDNVPCTQTYYECIERQWVIHLRICLSKASSLNHVSTRHTASGLLAAQRAASLSDLGTILLQLEYMAEKDLHCITVELVPTTGKSLVVLPQGDHPLRTCGHRVLHMLEFRRSSMTSLAF